MLWFLIMLSPWGVRTQPDPAGGVWLRWAGAGVARVDGVAAGGSPVHLAPGPHRVALGAAEFTVPDLRREPCAPLRFVALGDGRADADGVGPSAYWPGILAEALAVDPLFVLNTGDLVKRGGDRAEWDNYLRSLPPWPPVIATRGNHDKGPHFDRLGAGPGDVWAWRVGPVLVAGFDSEADLDRIPEMAARLDALLAAEAPWKVVFTHRPTWSRGPHGGDERKLNGVLVPIFERHGVAVVFAGHDHDYERFCPSLGLGAARRCDDAGVTYIVTGGAATFTMPFPGLTKNPTDRARDQAASRFFTGSRHFVQVDVDRGVMRLTTRRTRTGNVRPPAIIDQVVLTRPDPPACQARRDAGP